MAKITRTSGPSRASILGAAIGLSQTDGKVGWFESARYEGGKPVAGIAAVQEYGSASRGIPPRPYFRPTAEEQRPAWGKTAEQVSKAIIQGHMPPGALMEALCLKAESDVRRAIIAVTTPALKPATIAARKRKLAPGSKISAPTQKTMGITKPLVDSGLMLATLTSRIEDARSGL